MTQISPLSPDRLVRRCDTGSFTFTTTAELDDLAEGIGQTRAIDAAHFGIGMRHAGYNLYVMGEPGSGKRTLIRQLLDRRARMQRAVWSCSTRSASSGRRAWSGCWMRSNARLC
jgi:hypothetical protein